jgi:hypothetical protein
MTIAFEKFLVQFESTGREYLDGFDASHFEGMTLAELSEAESLLGQRAQEFDNVAIRALGVMGTDNAKRLLSSLLENSSSLTLEHLEVLQALSQFDGDEQYQEQIASGLSSSDLNVRRKAALALRITTPNTFVFSTFCELLKTEQESVIRTSAASGILRCFGIIKNPFELVQSRPCKIHKDQLGRG